jgi:hypothetical protein
VLPRRPSRADAVTLDRVVLANRPLSRSTLFHELVHVVQCQILGVDLFGERYLLEYVSHGYDSMPLDGWRSILLGATKREKSSTSQNLSSMRSEMWPSADPQDLVGVKSRPSCVLREERAEN